MKEVRPSEIVCFSENIQAKKLDFVLNLQMSKSSELSF